MLKDDTTERGFVYSRGFFAFLCGTAVLGVLLGTMCFCLDGKGLTGSAVRYLNAAADEHGTIDYGSLLAKSLWGNTVFLLGIGILGLCPVGQPFELVLLILRGMVLGYSMAQTYSVTGKDAVVYSIGLMLPGAVTGMFGLIAAEREALCLSGIYLRLTISDKPVQGLSDTVKLYGAKLLAAQALLTLAAGADILCNYLFIGRLGV